MGKYMGLDFGAKTVGVALSDELNIIVSPYKTIVRNKESQLRPTLREIVSLAKERNIETIIVGLPLNMNGSESERSQKSREFSELLSKRLIAEGLKIKVILHDERLTTMSADEILEESGVDWRDRKKYIDSVAASLILEDFLS